MLPRARRSSKRRKERDCVGDVQDFADDGGLYPGRPMAEYSQCGNTTRHGQPCPPRHIIEPAITAVEGASPRQLTCLSQ